VSDYEILQEMVDVLPTTVSNLSKGIIELNTSIEGLTEEQNGVEWSMSVMTTGASAWMDWKANDLNPTYTVVTSGGWSISNLIEWAIVDPAAGGDSSVVFSDTDVTSASPPTLPETQQFNRQAGFSAAYDHIHKVNSLTGTYGIVAKKASLTTGLGLMTDNRDKYQTVLKVYDRILREK